VTTCDTVVTLGDTLARCSRYNIKCYIKAHSPFMLYLRHNSSMFRSTGNNIGHKPGEESKTPKYLLLRAVQEQIGKVVCSCTLSDNFFQDQTSMTSLLQQYACCCLL